MLTIKVVLVERDNGAFPKLGVPQLRRKRLAYVTSSWAPLCFPMKLENKGKRRNNDTHSAFCAKRGKSFVSGLEIPGLLPAFMKQQQASLLVLFYAEETV